jgi:hypothetical protein
MIAVAAGAVLAAVLLAGCGNSSGGSGVTTSSLLDGKPAAGEGPKISNSDPMARPVQVAWTAARAQRCGFQFNAATLRGTFISIEQRNGQPVDQVTKAYDQTFEQISRQIADQKDYCTEKKSAQIKTDLTRHLAGDYTPNLPQPKVVAQKGWFDLDEDGKAKEPMKADEFWRDLEDKKYGRK